MIKLMEHETQSLLEGTRLNLSGWCHIQIKLVLQSATSKTMTIQLYIKNDKT